MIKEKKVEFLLPLGFLWSIVLLFFFVFHSERRYMFPALQVLLFLFACYLNYYFDKELDSEIICHSKENIFI